MRSLLNLIIIIGILAMTGIFVFQNNTPLAVHFFSWSYELTSGTIVLFSLIIGIFIGILWFVPRIIYRNFVIWSLKNKLEKTETWLAQTTQNVHSLTEIRENNEKKDMIIKEFLPK